MAELAPRRDLRHTPLFDVMFLHVERDGEEIHWPGLELRGGAFDAGASFESGAELGRLTFTLVDGAWGAAAGVRYQSALFDATTVKRLLGRFETLVGELVERPEAALDNLAGLTPAEQHQLAAEWNDTRRAWRFDGGVHRAIARRAAAYPDAPAIVDGAAVWSYGELRRRVQGLARHLRRRGVGPESVVGLGLERSPELVAAILGVLDTGAAFLPLDSKAPLERVDFQLRDAGADVFLWDTELEDEDSSEAVVPPLTADVTPGHRAYVIYTSGSTGRPKGVAVPHGALSNIVASFVESYGLSSSDRMLQQTTPAFDVAINEILPILTVGGALVLVPRGAELDFERLSSWVIAQGVTVLGAAPSVLARWNEKAGEGLGRLRLVLSGGEALAWSDVDALLEVASVVNGYGPTEATICALSHGLRSLGEEIPIGRPLTNYEALLLDRRGHAVGIGDVGEICLAGVGLARGYVARPTTTAEVFVPHPHGDGERLYRTGDLARWRADGRLLFLGRRDAQVKIRGLRVELGEIEARLGEHPAVRGAAAVLRDEQLVAFVVGPTAGLAEHLGESLPAYMVPSRFVALEGLPWTPSGKLDRRALEAWDLPQEKAARRAPRTPTEELVAEVWCELLGAGEIGVDEDFFVLGGHSLLATRVVSRLRDAFGVELPVKALFEAPTVAELAARLEHREDAARPPVLIARLWDGDERPLSFAQERMWFLQRLAPKDPAYNLPTAAYIDGPLDADVLAAALGALVARHEVLRTVFPAPDGQPRGRLADVGGTLHRADLRALPEAEAEALRRAGAELRRPFDLEAEPPLRALLLLLAPERHLLVLNLHHIVTDGWSSGLLLGELAELYRAARSGGVARLEPPAGALRRLRRLAAPLARG